MEEVENKNQSQYIEDDDARSLDNKYLDWYFRFGTLRHFVMLCRDMAERCVSVYQLKRAIRNLESSYVTNSFNQPELKKMAGSSFIQFVCLPPPSSGRMSDAPLATKSAPPLPIAAAVTRLSSACCFVRFDSYMVKVQKEKSQKS